MSRDNTQDRGLVHTIVGDGTPLLQLTAASLVFAGGFFMFLAAAGEFLPHDIRYLGMSAADLCAHADCRITQFMIHDRAAFGGALFCVGVLYGYLIMPLKNGEAWAWWLFLASGAVGFSSFLAYLSYGYLDTWHGLGTLLLLPLFLGGIVLTRRLVDPWRGPLSLITAGRLPDRHTLTGLGRAALLLGAGGTAIGGAVILSIGVTGIFVDTDLEFMGMRPEQFDAISPRLIPLIAHDRAGFGGAVLTTGLTAFFCLWCARLSRALWETMLIGGGVALTAAIATHFFVGYTNAAHLAPVLLAAASMVIGLSLTARAAVFRSSGAPGGPRAPASPRRADTVRGSGF
jgi:hypothetical protein